LFKFKNRIKHPFQRKTQNTTTTTTTDHTVKPQNLFFLFFTPSYTTHRQMSAVIGFHGTPQTSSYSKSSLGGGQYEGIGPMVNQGHVVANACVSRREIMKRRSRSPGTSFYPQPVRENILEVEPGEIVLSTKVPDFKTPGPGSTLKSDVDIIGMSSLNGFGEKSDRLYEIIEKLRFAGVAQTRTTEKDYDDSSHTNPRFVVVVGGTFTITNCGRDQICAGDWIYWDLPSPSGQVTGLIGRPKDKIVAIPRPFRGQIARASAEVMRENIANTSLKTAQSPQSINQYEDLSNCFVRSLLTSVSFIGKLIEKINDELNEPNNAEEGPKSIMLKAITAIKEYNEEIVEITERMNDIDKILSKDGLLHEMVKYLVPLTQKEAIVNSNAPGQKFLDNSNEKKIWDAQYNCVRDMFYCAHKMESFYTSRIFGQAIRGSSPGSPLDVLIGAGSYRT